MLTWLSTPGMLLDVDVGQQRVQALPRLTERDGPDRVVVVLDQQTGDVPGEPGGGDDTASLSVILSVLTPFIVTPVANGGFAGVRKRS